MTLLCYHGIMNSIKVGDILFYKDRNDIIEYGLVMSIDCKKDMVMLMSPSRPYWKQYDTRIFRILYSEWCKLNLDE
jgi:hypothetical protein